MIRLHVAGDHSDESRSQSNSPFGETPGVESFQQLFPKITGWELGMIPSSGQDIDGSHSQSMVIERGRQPLRKESGELGIVDMSAEQPAGKSCVSRQVCDSLLQTVNGFIHQIQSANRQIEILNAQAATSMPLISPDDDGEILLSRLESVIRQGLVALDLSAGGLYLLDDATRELKLRVQVGLSIDSFLKAPRKLKESIGDLEALVGNPFTISEIAAEGKWRPPEDFPAAMCVPVATHSTPLGTLWLYSKEKRSFSGADLSIAEILGGRMACEMERESATRQGTITKKLTKDIDRARLWQQLQTPPILPESQGWEMAGSQFLEQGIGGALYDFSISSNGQLVASVGDIQGAVFESGLAAATMRGAMRSLEPRNLNCDRFLYEVNNTLWNCPLGDQIGSLFQVAIEPQTGIAEWSNAGETGAIIIGAGSEIHIADACPPLGACPDESYERIERVLLPNSTLFAFNEGFRRLFKYQFRVASNEDILARIQDEKILRPHDIETWISDLVAGFDSYRSSPDVSFIAIFRQSDADLADSNSKSDPTELTTS